MKYNKVNVCKFVGFVRPHPQPLSLKKGEGSLEVKYFVNKEFEMLKRGIKLFFELLLLLIITFCLVWNKLVIYGVSQGIGQMTMIVKAKPMQEMLDDKAFPDSLKQKLKLIEELKQYAVDSIGIKSSNNYSTVYNQNNKPILFTVTACEPYAFKAKEWWFPFLGNVSYKGFFNKKEAQKEIRLLKQNGYDVDVYSPSGWSTLGWFTDPVQTNMLNQSDGSIANLIIHELTHGTIYIKNDVTFNENLASFIGDKGAEQFLMFKFGTTSKPYKDYEEHKKDSKLFTAYMLKSKDRLDSLYTSFSGKETEGIKKTKKEQLITQIVVGVYDQHLFKKKNYFNYSLQAFSEGNAFFMAFTRYDSQYDVFEKEYKEHYHSNLKMYLEAMKQKYSLR